MSPKVGVAPLRREQIVRATIRCLARDGYAGLTMKKVARTAGVSQGILHYYFADKRAILVAALEMVRTIDRTSVICIRNDRYVDIPNYESWWDVPLAEVSEMPQVEYARAEWAAMREHECYFLG